MDVGGFWKLIELIDRQKMSQGEGFDEEAVQPLIEGLATLREDELRAFEDHLAYCLYQLDGRAFADASGESGTSDDGFLYARCFVVASGRELFEATVNNPSLMPKSLAQWCEPLLFSAARAWQVKHGSEWEYAPNHPIETGSNVAQW